MTLDTRGARKSDSTVVQRLWDPSCRVSIFDAPLGQSPYKNESLFAYASQQAMTRDSRLPSDTAGMRSWERRATAKKALGC